MFLTVHTAVGVLIGQNLNSSFWGFIIGLISHWLLDVIPHGDENIFTDNLEKKEFKKRLLIVAGADLVGVGLLFIFLNNHIQITSPIIFSSLGAITPDVLWGVSEFVPIKKLLSPINKLHENFHRLTKIVVSLKVGLATQITALVLTILLILR